MDGVILRSARFWITRWRWWSDEWRMMNRKGEVPVPVTEPTPQPGSKRIQIGFPGEPVLRIATPSAMIVPEFFKGSARLLRPQWDFGRRRRRTDCWQPKDLQTDSRQDCM